MSDAVTEAAPYTLPDGSYTNAGEVVEVRVPFFSSLLPPVLVCSVLVPSFTSPPLPFFPSAVFEMNNYTDSAFINIHH